MRDSPVEANVVTRSASADSDLERVVGRRRARRLEHAGGQAFSIAITKLPNQSAWETEAGLRFGEATIRAGRPHRSCHARSRGGGLSDLPLVTTTHHGMNPPIQGENHEAAQQVLGKKPHVVNS